LATTEKSAQERTAGRATRPGTIRPPAQRREPAPARKRVARAAKRAIDVAVASVLLVLLAPLWAVVAVVVRLDSPGPALFRQRRYGRGL
jgi:lipopolysaccharide/colanic/teichoic acid biosynthesis glycosyltransferase